MTPELFDSVDQYIRQLLAPEDAALENAMASLEANDIPNISVSANQGKLLQLFAKLCNAKNILELGTLVGYSTIWMARALPENGKLISLEFDPKRAEVARQNIAQAGLSNKVEIRVGKALDHLQQLEAEKAGPFDLIFIDADKPPYADYFQHALRLARPGTVIIADNVIRRGQVLDANSSDENVQGARRFNELLAQSKNVSATILQTVGGKSHDGIAIAIVN